MLLLSGPQRRGGRWADHRMVINGIFFRTRAGCPWRDLPEGFGNWKTIYNRHRRWSLDGTWEQILDGLRAGCDEAEGKDWTVSADSTVARAHQHAAGARRVPAADDSQGALANDKKSGREAIGESRGGLTTKIHLAADLRCRPVARLTSCGQHGDSPRFVPLMDAIRVRRRGPGRPRRRPGRAMADKAYSSRANRAWLRQHGIQAVIPVKKDQKKHRRDRGRAGGRPPAFDVSLYKKRNTVERCFSKLKQFRAVATRRQARAHYQGTIDVASISPGCATRP